MIGCNRGYYRRQADAVATRLIQEKSCDPRWNTWDGSIEIDPQSRMFNPFSFDHPPIPPDDAASHQLMHCVDGHPGYPQWHANGDTDYVANPEWRSYLPVNEKGQVVLTMDRAFQLALLHSPELQEQKETLYLSALDVSLERFGFDTQLFAGFNSFFTTQGRLRNGDDRSSSVLSGELGANGEGINFERLGITGTNYVVGLANTILFNFAGPDTQSANSLINFSIVQPLLRGAGRDRIMESLTQSERTLLANVRQFDRFLRGFYLRIAIERNPGAGPNLIGNFLGLPAGNPLNVGGFLGLLQQQQQIRNQELNVRQLEAVLEQFRELFERERFDAVQLKLFESTVYNQQSSLVEARVRYQTAVDRYKILLGLPPDLEVVIQDDFLDQFKLISDQVNERLIAIGDLREETGGALNLIDDLLPANKSLVEPSGFRWSEELGQRIFELKPYLEKAEATLQSIKEEDLQELNADFEKLDSVRSDRIAYLENLRRAIEDEEIISDVDPRLYQTDSIPSSADLKISLNLQENERSLVNRIKQLETQLSRTKSIIEEMEQTQAGFTNDRLYEFIVKQLQESIPGMLSELNNILLETSLLQAQARSNSIEIPDVDINAAEATQIAKCLRRDWMNARASLVDNWRQIEFVADNLESQFDLILEGDIRNDSDNNPFNLRYETGQLRGGFRFDTPIVRVSERNQYREALIAYRQTRSRFYQFEDEISRNLREIVRNINRDKVLFELNRRSVQVQVEQIELNRLSLEEPVAIDAGNAQLGSSTARNLTDAIIGLNDSQDRFLGTWVEYEVLRRNLDFDMGTMQLDEFGAWIDPGQIDDSIGLRAAAAMGISPDCQFCDPNLFPSLCEAAGVCADDYVGEEIEVLTESADPSVPVESPAGRLDEPTEPTDSLPELNPPADSGGYFQPVPGMQGKARPSLKRSTSNTAIDQIELGFSPMDSTIKRLPAFPTIRKTPGNGINGLVSSTEELEANSDPAEPLAHKVADIPTTTNGFSGTSGFANPPSRFPSGSASTVAENLTNAEFRSFGQHRFDRFQMTPESTEAD